MRVGELSTRQVWLLAAVPYLALQLVSIAYIDAHAQAGSWADAALWLVCVLAGFLIRTPFALFLSLAPIALAIPFGLPSVGYEPSPVFVSEAFLAPYYAALIGFGVVLGTQRWRQLIVFMGVAAALLLYGVVVRPWLEHANRWVAADDVERAAALEAGAAGVDSDYRCESDGDDGLGTWRCEAQQDTPRGNLIVIKVNRAGRYSYHAEGDPSFPHVKGLERCCVHVEDP
jgi:hypothetical protein